MITIEHIVAVSLALVALASLDLDSSSKQREMADLLKTSAWNRLPVKIHLQHGRERCLYLSNADALEYVDTCKHYVQALFPSQFTVLDVPSPN